MIRAEITNFESIDHAVIEIDGFTTVQGPNYSGKSAAMRAINAALTNLSGTEFISWGKTFCEVRIEAEGLDLLWHKEDGNNFYVVNGTKYSKTGRDEPPDELSNLGYGTVRINGVRHNLHFADQFNPLFLVNQQNTRNSDLIASAYGLDRLYKASELCSKDQKSSEALLKIRKKDLEDVSQDLKKYEGLDDVISAGARLKAAASEIEGTESKAAMARQWHLTVIQGASECNRLKASFSVEMPATEDLSSACTAHRVALAMLGRMDSCSSEVHRLSSIEACVVPEGGDLASRAEDHRSLMSLAERLEVAEAGANKLSACEGVHVSSHDDMSSVVSGIGVLSMLKKAVSDIVSFKKDSEGLMSERDTCSAELDALDKERAKYGVCPLCGGKL